MSDESRFFVVVMAILLTAFAISLSATIGFFLGAGIGFAFFSACIAACIVVTAVSYVRSTRE